MKKFCGDLFCVNLPKLIIRDSKIYFVKFMCVRLYLSRICQIFFPTDLKLNWILKCFRTIFYSKSIQNKQSLSEMETSILNRLAYKRFGVQTPVLGPITVRVDRIYVKFHKTSFISYVNCLYLDDK